MTQVAHCIIGHWIKSNITLHFTETFLLILIRLLHEWFVVFLHSPFSPFVNFGPTKIDIIICIDEKLGRNLFVLIIPKVVGL